MTEYSTGNPVPSVDVRDLYDNAQNLDNFSNGQLDEYADRLGVSRKSLAGMRTDFSAFLAASGFETPVLTYTDSVPLQVDRPTQLLERASDPGTLYSIKLPSSFPVVLSGTWATDEALLIVRVDQALRQDLADDTDPLLGAGQVGYDGALAYAANTAGGALNDLLAGSNSHASQLSAINIAIVTPQQFGAVSDGTTHPLSEFYATLGEAQAVYPHATDLTNEIDWAACQSAINASLSVYFGDYTKQYYFDGQDLEPRDNSAYTGVKARIFQADATAEIFSKLEISNVVFSGLTLIGASPVPLVADGTNRAIELFGPTNVLIEKCEFLNWGSAGVFLSGKDAVAGPTNCHVINNHFDNCNDAIFFYIGGRDNVISHNMILECGRGGIFLDDVSLSDVGSTAVAFRDSVIIGNTIRGFGGFAAGYGITTGLTRNCVISKNIILDGTGDGISIFAGGTSDDPPLPSGYNTVSDNHISAITGTGIILIAGFNCTITGNTLVDCWLNGVAGARAFMEFQSMTRNAVTIDSTGNLITSNQLIKVSAGSDMDYGIRYNTNNNNNHAFSNRIIGATTAAILDQGTGNTAANNPVT